MSVGFIVGRSGTGKTRYCLDEIINELLDQDSDQTLILLVPEQATYQAERAILTDPRINGYSRLHILSFNRLSFWITQRETVLESLSSLGREMIVSRLLHKHADELKVFSGSAHQQGLAVKVCDMIVEMQKYEKTPADIIDFVKAGSEKGADERMLAKFSDIALIYSDYLEYIKDRFVNPDVSLSNASKVVRDSEFINGAKVWVDGFSSFNAQERNLLVEILKVAQQTNIALCVDSDSDCFSLLEPDKKTLDPTSMFSPTECLYCELHEILKKCKIDIDGPIVLEENWRFKNSESLKHVEDNIFKNEIDRNVKDDGSIRIASAKNVRAEVEFVAREICRLIREKGYRYRDVCVIASDIDSYETYLRSVFGEYALPYFIDQRKSIKHHPVIEMVTSALNCVIKEFAFLDVFSFLKTGLAGVSNYEIERLENYCLANGVSSCDWLRNDPWDFSSDTSKQNEIDQIRRRAVKDLLWLKSELGCECIENEISVEKFVSIVFDFTQKLGVPAQMADWVMNADQIGDFAKADEHRQFYDQFISLLDELTKVFRGETLELDELLAIVQNAFGEMTLAFVPPCQDQIIVGSIERSRLPDIKAAFLVGATQKGFPVPVGSSGILSDADRMFAQAVDFELAQGLSQQLIARQYLAYISFTRASELLFVTYPRENEKGAEIQRSAFLNHVCGLFEPALQEQAVCESSFDLKDCHNGFQLSDVLCSNLGADSESEDELGLYTNLKDAVTKDSDLGGYGRLVQSALDYENKASLSESVVKEFYDKTLRCSVSRLSKFATCPYQHFAQYGLNLEPRTQFRLEPVDIGNFYHNVLDKLSQKLKGLGSDFASHDSESLNKLLGESIREYVEEDDFIRNFQKHSQHNSFIIDSAYEILEDCVSMIAQMSKAGDFRLYDSEMAFGKNSDELGECVVKDDTGSAVHLRGVIDRLDIAEVDGESVAMVYDYKTNGKALKWSNVYHGLDLQLLVYLIAVYNKKVDGKELRPGGGFYMPIEITPQKTELDEIEKQKQKNPYRTNGMFNGEYAFNLESDVEKSSKYYKFQVSQKSGQYGYYNNGSVLKPRDFENVLNFAREKIITIAKSLIGGDISIRPYRMGQASPCAWCDFKSLCRFDWQINEYNMLEKVDKKQMLEMLTGEDD